MGHGVLSVTNGTHRVIDKVHCMVEWPMSEMPAAGAESAGPERPTPLRSSDNRPPWGWHWLSRDGKQFAKEYYGGEVYWAHSSDEWWALKELGNSIHTGFGLGLKNRNMVRTVEAVDKLNCALSHCLSFSQENHHNCFVIKLQSLINLFSYNSLIHGRVYRCNILHNTVYGIVQYILNYSVYGTVFYALQEVLQH